MSLENITDQVRPVFDSRISRRGLLKGGLGALALTVTGPLLTPAEITSAKSSNPDQNTNKNPENVWIADNEGSPLGCYIPHPANWTSEFVNNGLQSSQELTRIDSQDPSYPGRMAIKVVSLDKNASLSASMDLLRDAYAGAIGRQTGNPKEAFDSSSPYYLQVGDTVLGNGGDKNLNAYNAIRIVGKFPPGTGYAIRSEATAEEDLQKGDLSFIQFIIPTDHNKWSIFGTSIEPEDIQTMDSIAYGMRIVR